MSYSYQDIELFLPKNKKFIPLIKKHIDLSETKIVFYTVCTIFNFNYYIIVTNKGDILCFRTNIIIISNRWSHLVLKKKDDTDEDTADDELSSDESEQEVVFFKHFFLKRRFESAAELTIENSRDIIFHHYKLNHYILKEISDKIDQKLKELELKIN